MGGWEETQVSARDPEVSLIPVLLASPVSQPDLSLNLFYPSVFGVSGIDLEMENLAFANLPATWLPDSMHLGLLAVSTKDFSVSYLMYSFCFWMDHLDQSLCERVGEDRGGSTLKAVSNIPAFWYFGIRCPEVPFLVDYWSKS